jgi:hypothetical protein
VKVRKYSSSDDHLELLERGQIQKKLKEYFPNSTRHFNKDPIAESEYLCNVDKILASYLLSSAGYEYVSVLGVTNFSQVGFSL